MQQVPSRRMIPLRRVRSMALGAVLVVLAVGGAADPASGTAAGSAGDRPASIDAALGLYGAGEPALARDVRAALDLGVDPGMLAELLVRARETGLAADALGPVLARVLTAAAAELPVEPLFGRYLQGFSKSVPIERIHPVAGELLDRLQVAAQHVDARCARFPGETARADRLAAIDHAAYALGVGLTPDYLDRSLELLSAPDRTCADVRAPVLAMGLLASVGLEGGRSFEVVQAAWNHGLRGAELERLGEAVLRLGQSGQAPIDIAAHVLDLIEQALPTDAILRDLDTLQGEIGNDPLPPGPAGGDHPSRRRVPGDRPDTPDPGRSGDGMRLLPDQGDGTR